jgi:hypothetical protein
VELPTVKIGKRTFTILFPGLLRDLTQDEMVNLRKSVRRNGVVTPVVVDENDGVIDGANRLRVAEELDCKTVPVEVRRGLTHEKKRELARSLNIDRRQLTRAEVREQIAESLKDDPTQSDNKVAQEIGVSHNTVAAVREDLESRCQIDNVEQRTDTKGRKQPGRKPRKPKPAPRPCARCLRIGSPGCPKCKKNFPDGFPREPGDDTSTEEMTDDAGVVVPEVARPAFLKAKEIAALCREIDDILHRALDLAKGPGGRMIRIGSVEQQLKDAKGNLWANRATHVCPYCRGEGKSCKPCQGEGWTARHVWEQSPGNNGKASRLAIG